MKNVKAKKSSKLSKLRINIDSDWTMSDFANLFREIESLYSMHREYSEGLKLIKDKKRSKTKYIDKRHTPLFHFMSSRSIIRSFYHEEGIYHENDNIFISGRISSELTVVSVQYSSPGFTDIAGLSGALGHLKEILMHYLPNKSTRQDIKIKEQERIRLQIQNLKEMGFSSVEIKKIVLLEEMSLEKMKLLFDEGKVTSLELTEVKK